MNFLKHIAKISLFTFLTASFVQTVSAQTIGSVTGNNVNIRNEASTSSEVITKLSAGEALEIVGKENDFYAINIDGAKLYISAEFAEVLQTEGIVTDNKVNIRKGPDTEAEILGKALRDCVFNVTANYEKWVKIDYFGEDGYISKDFIKGDYIEYIKLTAAPASVIITDESPSDDSSAGEAYALITSNTGLRLRKEPSTESDVLSVLRSGDAVDVIDENVGEWVKVSYNDSVGYVSKEFVALGYGEKPQNKSGLGYQIIDYGKQFLGTPYLWAGNNLRTGVDCSGFVYNVFKNFGISLNRSSRTMVNDGYKISKSDLQVGDLVFFDTNGGANNGNISHVGIYMGDGNFIHSSSSKRTWGVTISSLSEDYYVRNYVTACRVL